MLFFQFRIIETPIVKRPDGLVRVDRRSDLFAHRGSLGVRFLLSKRRCLAGSLGVGTFAGRGGIRVIVDILGLSISPIPIYTLPKHTLWISSTSRLPATLAYPFLPAIWASCGPIIGHVMAVMVKAEALPTDAFVARVLSEAGVECPKKGQTLENRSSDETCILDDE